MRFRKLTSLTMAATMSVGLMNGFAVPVMAAKGDALDMSGYNLVWEDEFNGSELNRDDWNVELHDPGWVNSELQAYVDSEENIYVEDGYLYLNPVKKVETIETEVPSGDVNILANADFSSGLDGWTETIANWDNPPLADATRSIADGAITYDISAVGTDDWNIQLKQEGLSLKAGATYHASYTVTSSVTRQIKSGVMSADYNWFGGSDPVLEAGVATPIEFDFTMGSDCNNAQFYISMGYCGEGTEPGTITISDISLTTEYVADEESTSTTTEKVTYTSGRINTQDKHAYTYGVYEVRAKVPAGQGYLPAFWLMANDENIYGQWPRCGEIDCMEVMGQDPSKLYGTIHFGNPHSESQGTAYATDPDFSEDFHTFTTEWEPGKIRWYVDGVLYHEESSWYSTTEGQGTLTYPAPFDQPFYIILNLAVGGSWVGNPDETTSFDNNPYVVDYVRVYQKDSYDDEGLEAPVQEFNPRDPAEDGNYISDDASDWTFLTALGGVGSETMEDCVITVSTDDAGTVDYSIQLVQANIPLEKGATYEVQFDAYADADRTMNVDVKAPDHGYKAYMSTFKPQLTTENQTFTTTFVMKDASDENGRLEFNMGATDSTATIYLSNISVKKIADPDPNAKEEKTVLANGNYIYNGSFQEGTRHLGYWTVADSENVSVTSFSDGRRLKVSADTAISQEELAFTEGTPYALSFEAEGEGTVTITVGGNVYTTEVTDTNSYYTFKIPGDATFENQDITIEFSGVGTMYFDNVKLVEDSMIKNGSFKDGITGYEVYVDSSANASYVVDSLQEDNALSVTVNNTGDQDWKIQVKQNNVTLEKGKTYRLTFDAKSTIERNIRVVMQGLEPLGWPVYSSDPTITVGPQYETYSETFTMNHDTDANAFLSICLGNVTEQITDQHVICVDNIILEEVVDEPDEPIVETFEIVTQPVDSNVLVGETATYSVEAIGAESYQWYYSKDGKTWRKSTLEGAQTDTISLKVAKLYLDNKYKCIVSDAEGNTLESDVVRNIVSDTALKITSQPQDYDLSQGKAVYYEIEAENAETYQWYYSKDNGATWYKSSIAGSDSNLLGLTASASNVGNVYRCKVTGTDGSTLYSDIVKMTSVPCITEQPQTVTYSAGATAEYTVVVENADDAEYQWYYSKDNGETWYKSSATGATTSSMSLRMSSTNAGHQYRCKIKTAVGITLTSDAVYAVQ